MTSTSKSSAIVLFGHGARDPQWAEPMLRLKAMLEQRQPGLVVELAFLELMEPTLPVCVNGLLQRDCTAVQVVPVFFGKGAHLKNDFPALLADLRQQHPELELSATDAVGQWDAVWEAIAGEILSRNH